MNLLNISDNQEGRWGREPGKSPPCGVSEYFKNVY